MLVGVVRGIVQRLFCLENERFYGLSVSRIYFVWGDWHFAERVLTGAGVS
jgi:hypothetical protein